MRFQFTNTHKHTRAKKSHRSPGTQYGGRINISHLAVYGDANINAHGVGIIGGGGRRTIRFVTPAAALATIRRRQDMNAVPVRCMIVVSVVA